MSAAHGHPSPTAPTGATPPAAHGTPDRAVVARTAALARLALSDAELDAVAPQFARILGSFEALRGLDTSGVEPMTRPIELAMIMRQDVPGDCLDPQAALAPAPKQVNGFFAVPKTLEAEG